MTEFMNELLVLIILVFVLMIIKYEVHELNKSFRVADVNCPVEKFSGLQLFHACMLLLIMANATRTHKCQNLKVSKWDFYNLNFDC